jgi:hypothetical protein
VNGVAAKLLQSIGAEAQGVREILRFLEFAQRFVKRRHLLLLRVLFAPDGDDKGAQHGRSGQRRVGAPTCACFVPNERDLIRQNVHREGYRRVRLGPQGAFPIWFCCFVAQLYPVS